MFKVFWIVIGVVSSVLAQFLWLAFSEVVLKPIAIKLGGDALTKAVSPAFDALDDLIQLPENWEKFTDGGVDWLKDTVIPQSAPGLTDVQALALANILIEKFDLKTFLEKQNGQK